MKKIHFSFIFIFFALFFNIFVSQSYAGVKQKEVIVTGSGVTEPDALNYALIHAVSQVSGLAINSSQVLDIKKKIEDGKKSASRDIQKNIQTYTKGIISSYEILSSDKTNEGLVNLKIKAVVPVYDAGNQINRLRLAIVPFRISEKITNRTASQDYYCYACTTVYKSVPSYEKKQTRCVSVVRVKDDGRYVVVCSQFKSVYTI